MGSPEMLGWLVVRCLLDELGGGGCRVCTSGLSRSYYSAFYSTQFMSLSLSLSRGFDSGFEAALR